MRAFEFCPNEFECFMSSANIHQTFAEMDLKYQYHSLPNILELTMVLVKSFKISIPHCESVTKEGQAYIKKIEEIANSIHYSILSH